MPKLWIKRKSEDEVRIMRNAQRKRNYRRGCFGEKRSARYKSWEVYFISHKLFSDRVLAWLFGRSVLGIQVMRWRLKKGYSLKSSSVV